ncbi:MAG TPA: helix-turn-helix transcriptional regulator [Sphingomicrobium sp.]|nr:helix-turn-helix transcriptional regulator [Sphingomicrobium sp.]
MTETKELTVECRPVLSPRQEQCLRGVLELKSAKEIARDLGISPGSVEKHLRISREKLGATTSAEAARIFAALEGGKDFPHGGFSDLPSWRNAPHQRAVLERFGHVGSGGLGDSHGALSLDQPLSPRQTLLTIAAVSFGSIVGLLLLVACAEGIRALVTH